jgi:hypothetical protein
MGMRSWIRAAALVATVGLVLAGCGSDPEFDIPDVSDDPSLSTARPTRDPFWPQGSFEPIEAELTGTLPRSMEFQGVRFTVDRARITNTHPYTIFGDPRPGELLFVVLDVTAENTTDEATRYQFNEEAFGLRTYSGQLLPIVDPIGIYDFSRLEPRQTQSDQLVFGTHAADVLDGASLLVGRPPDSPAILALTSPPREPLYPTDVVAVSAGPTQAGPISWTVTRGQASLDLPAGVCCPETGARADDGELFVTLTIRGTVRGSQYGQASVTSSLVRLVADGQADEPFGFEGQANVKEGTPYEFDVTWLIAADVGSLALEVGTGTSEVRTIELSIGIPVPSPEPYVPPQPAASRSPEPSISGSPGPSIQPTSAPDASGPPKASSGTGPTPNPDVSPSPTLTASPPPVAP